ncbi:Pentatricopeptide repeat [Arabidopsis thaliana x Arabidopsis arenosa]|uniref:Pentatricopeptide repeat n=1 Tax=Arabidopsis thaliana x Arabidopsis arenosa TaxID=1240361 RepID=A0A8T2BN64_9BRAS|nr:Pentatricopeptide repeat [Arabidopsis thaliana x Arabidopsis arenosa]
MYRALWLSPLRFIVSSSSSKFTPYVSRGRGLSGIDNGAGCSCSRSVTTVIGNEFIRCQDESKILQVQIVDALRSGERPGASALLFQFIQGNYSLSAHDFHDILYYCARSPDPVFVMETYSVMCKKEISLDSRSLLFIVQSLCNGGHLDKASEFIHAVGEDDSISPILPVYNYFLGACAKTRSVYHASKCLELMDQRRVGKNEITYAALLKLAVFQRNLSAVNDIWKHYVNHYSLDILPLRKFIWSFTRLGDLKSAYELLQHMVDLASRGELFVKSNRGKLHSMTLDIPVPAKGETGSEKVAFGVNDHNVEYNSSSKVALPKGHNKIPATKVLRWSFNDVIHACGQSKNSELAEQLMLQMQNIGLLPSSHTYDGFIRAVAFPGGYEYGMTLLKVMQQQNLKPYDSTLATVSAYCSKAFQVDLAEHLLDQISECSYAYPFNNLLAAYDSLDQPERAVRVLARMKQLKLRPDMRTYELLFSLFGNVNAPYEEGNMLSQVDCCKRINAIEMDMVRNGFQHSPISRRNVLRALGAEGMVNEMIRHLQKAENLNVHSNMYLGTPTYNIVLHSLLEANETDMVINIFKRMKSCGCPADVATYNIMIDCCSIIHSYKSACALVSMMIRDGFSPKAVTFTALMKILLNDGNFEEALNLLDQAALEEIHLDVLSYNTILRKAFEKGMIDVIEYIVEQMHREKVNPDPTTCHYVFTCYVEKGYHATAIEALNVLSLRMLNEEDKESLQEKKIELEENFVMSEDPEAETKIIELFRNSEEHLAAALLNLRWCAMLGARIIWSEDQSPWARGLSNKYG